MLQSGLEIILKPQKCTPPPAGRPSAVHPELSTALDGHPGKIMGGNTQDPLVAIGPQPIFPNQRVQHGQSDPGPAFFGTVSPRHLFLPRESQETPRVPGHRRRFEDARRKKATRDRSPPCGWLV